VKKQSINYLGFEVDKLTRSIENVATSDSFETEIGVLKEPLDVDFFVDPKPLTNKEKELLSKYLKAYKLKLENKKQKAK
jgi:hypothetical protein